MFLANIHEIIHRSVYSLFFVVTPIFSGHNGTWIHAECCMTGAMPGEISKMAFLVVFFFRCAVGAVLGNFVLKFDCLF